VFKALTPSRLDDFAHVLRSCASGSTKAGFTKVRALLRVPKGWTPRVTMRATGRMPRT
jgi:hypothetical protein